MSVETIPIRKRRRGETTCRCRPPDPARSRVLGTWHHGKSTIRRRRCEVCGGTFHTEETPGVLGR